MLGVLWAALTVRVARCSSAAPLAARCTTRCSSPSPALFLGVRIGVAPPATPAARWPQITPRPPSASRAVPMPNIHSLFLVSVMAAWWRTCCADRRRLNIFWAFLIARRWRRPIPRKKIGLIEELFPPPTTRGAAVAAPALDGDPPRRLLVARAARAAAARRWVVTDTVGDEALSPRTCIRPRGLGIRFFRTSRPRRAAAMALPVASAC